MQLEVLLDLCGQDKKDVILRRVLWAEESPVSYAEILRFAQNDITKEVDGCQD